MSDDLRAYYATAGIPKVYREKTAPRRLRVKAKPKVERDRIAEVRDYVRGRERGRCRCCRFRAGHSMHELRPRSIGGKVSKRNSVWVCGDGTRGCHALLQQHVIDFKHATPAGAEGVITFTPTDRSSADWLKVKVGELIESAPMREMESD